MPTSSRLRGNLNPVFTIKVGAGTATSYSDDLKGVELTSEEGDEGDLTFAEAAAGLASAHSLNLTGIVSFDAGALYGFLWDNPGKDVDIVYGPYGNATATATKPHFTMTVNTGRLPGFGTTARTSKEGAEFTHELRLNAPPVKKVS
jgi:hypothetical protein